MSNIACVLLRAPLSYTSFASALIWVPRFEIGQQGFFVVFWRDFGCLKLLGDRLNTFKRKPCWPISSWWEDSFHLDDSEHSPKAQWCWNKAVLLLMWYQLISNQYVYELGTFSSSSSAIRICHLKVNSNWKLCNSKLNQLWPMGPTFIYVFFWSNGVKHKNEKHSDSE